MNPADLTQALHLPVNRDETKQDEAGSFESASGGDSGASGAMGSAYSEYLGINDSFPFKLHLMLTEMEEQGCGHIVSWQPHGRCFVVHDRKKFLKQIMPTFFRMSKYASFQRQLNIYGFNRITAGRDKGGYYHESFVRGCLDLCFDIQREKVKGTCVRKPASPEKEPDFYMLPFAPPSIPTKTNAGVLSPSSRYNTLNPSKTPLETMLASTFCESSPPGGHRHSLASILAPESKSFDYTVTCDSSVLKTPIVSVCSGGFQDHQGGYQTAPELFPRSGESLNADPQNACELHCYARDQQQQYALNDLDKSFETLLAALRAGVDSSSASSVDATSRPINL